MGEEDFLIIHNPVNTLPVIPNPIGNPIYSLAFTPYQLDSRFRGNDASSLAYS
jgi:hypothetical protein